MQEVRAFAGAEIANFLRPENSGIVGHDHLTSTRHATIYLIHDQIGSDDAAHRVALFEKGLPQQLRLPARPPVR
jgi:hypothetical protein